MAIASHPPRLDETKSLPYAPRNRRIRFPRRPRPVPDLGERPRYTVMAWGRLKFGLQYRTSGSINDGNYGNVFFTKWSMFPKMSIYPLAKNVATKSPWTKWRSLGKMNVTKWGAFKCIHTYILTYILTNLHTYILTYLHTYIHTYIHACMHAYIHTYRHTYIHYIMTWHYITDIHTYIHT
jgi:hypothetical protein